MLKLTFRKSDNAKAKARDTKKVCPPDSVVSGLEQADSIFTSKSNTGLPSVSLRIASK